MAPVVIILSISFWAVPAFMREEPVMTSGPTTGVMAIPARRLISLSGLQLTAATVAQSDSAYSIPPST
ncbi:Uncharacterised protein [Klebsiella pneumoniae]|nr:Uncharacterised protein [Klebsiella pneumoniae]